MKPNPARPTLVHRLVPHQVGLPLLGSLAVAASIFAPGASAAPSGIPSSCAALDAKYFHSGLTYGRVPYTLATQTTHTGSAIGVVSYSEGTFRLQPAAGLSGFLEADSFPQYFSNRRDTVSWSAATKPFDPASTDLLSIVLEETKPIPPSTPAALTGHVVLDSWGGAIQQLNVQGCIDDNIIYGTVQTTKGDSLASIALGTLAAPN